MSSFTEYGDYDGLGLAELVRKREVRPGELVEEAITRIERLNPHLNAVIQPMYDLARQAAAGRLPDGPFTGIPFLLKDLLADFSGVPTCRGSRFHQEYLPGRDSEMTRRYKAAGVIIIGKTNTPEYGMVPVTEPRLFGPTRNPWDPRLSPGGSSGGSAAAVAARLVPLAHGNDGGGSIRIPASCCGVFGLKPTRGRNPLGPEIGEAWSGLACDHVITRSVRDSAAMLDATAGPDVGAPYFTPAPARSFLSEVGAKPGKLKIAYTSKPFIPGKVHPDCIRGLETTVSLCRDLGHTIEEAAPPIDGRSFAMAFLTMVCGEIRADIEEAEILLEKKASVKDFEPATWGVGLLGKQIPAPEFSRAIRWLLRTARTVAEFFEDYDVLLTPTMSEPPVETGSFQPRGIEAWALKLLAHFNSGRLMRSLARVESLAEEVFRYIPYTQVFNASGQPAMSVPLFWNEAGVPIGMQFAARFGDEATLFRLAAQLEEARPWADRLPSVCA